MTQIKRHLFVYLGKNCLKRFFITLIFKTTCLKHFYQPNQITICINPNISLLTVSPLKYSSSKLRQFEPYKLNVDL